MPTRVIMPQLGESVVEGTVSRWMKQAGETVEEYEALLEINTDKVDSEIPSPAAGTVLQILVPEGETVRAGTLLAWIGEPGEDLPGQPGLGGQEQSQPAPVEQAAAAPNEAQPAAQRTYAAGRDQDLGFVSPIVARLALEHNLDLAEIRGSGQGGRITKKDVLAYLEAARPPADASAVAEGAASEIAPWETPGEGDLFRPTEMMFKKTMQKTETPRAGEPAGPGSRLEQPERAASTLPAPSARASAGNIKASMDGEPSAGSAPPAGQPVPGRLLPLNAMRRKIAEHMQNSVRTAPHVTTVMEADLQRVQAHLEANRTRFAQEGLRLTYTAYFAAATVHALQAHPMANSSWTDDGIFLHDQVNLGMAVSLEADGLIVPVIKNAGDLSLSGLARAIQELAARTRAGRLQPGEVRDGTFTITNHGISGSLMATPIINQPQCAILGVGAIQKRVVVSAENSIAIRPMVYLSLTFDHRILDGASADGFLDEVVKNLENWQ